MRLRRWSAPVLVLFALMVLVGTARAHALALLAGDELCTVMGGTAAPRLPTADPSDVADPSHACCDLGSCLEGGAAPLPAAAAPLAAPLSPARRSIRPRETSRRLARRRSPASPRAPPAL